MNADNVSRFSASPLPSIMPSLATYAEILTIRHASTSQPCGEDLSMSQPQERPSIDGYYRELHITLMSPFGEELKTVVMSLDDLMPDHASWRNAAATYQLKIKPVMRARTMITNLDATAFWNQGRDSV